MNISFPTIPHKPPVDRTTVRRRWAFAQLAALKFTQCWRGALAASHNAARAIAATRSAARGGATDGKQGQGENS
jgi:hypothetical protein